MYASQSLARKRPAAAPAVARDNALRASAGPGAGAAGGILAMQQAQGNQAVQRWLRAGIIRPKLAVGAPGDVYEQEAERMADRVTEMPSPATASPTSAGRPIPGDRVHRLCSKCEEEVQREPAGGGSRAAESSGAARGPAEVGPPWDARILGLRGRGDPLSRGVRDFFEPRFGRDLSHVRVHADDDAARSARAIQARAYAFGPDIVFDTGEYAPGTPRGLWLLAHELTHVIQQQPGEARAEPEGGGPVAVRNRAETGPYVIRAYGPCAQPKYPAACYGRCGTGGVCSREAGMGGKCICMGSARTELPDWLKVLIPAAAAAGLAACIATGVCEVAAVVALVGEGLAAAVEAFLVSIGVVLAESDTAGTGDSATATADSSATDDTSDDQTEVAVQDTDASDTSSDSATSDDEDEVAA